MGIGGVIGAPLGAGGGWLGLNAGLWGGTTTGFYTIYQYIEDGFVRYIGQTGNFANRAGQHMRKGWQVRPIPGLENLSKFDARAVEQVLIEHYKLANLYNKINSIAKTNPIYDEAIRRGTEILNRIRFFR